jgi:large subunit ribosomal protein L10
MREVAQSKKDAVASLVDAFVNNPVVGIARIDGIPAPQMQMMRRKLRGKVGLVVSKNRLINIALKEASAKRKDIEKLAKVIEGQTAIVTADINPFRLFKEMESTKTKAPAKGGEAAPYDILVRAGDTPFKPGPIVGDLQKAGLPAAIEGGKVVIKSDRVLVKTGERIPKDVANVLTRLEIYPLTVGLDLRGAYEDGLVYDRSLLEIDEEAILQDVRNAAQHSLNLAVYLAYPTSQTIPILVSKAHSNALNLAINANVPTSETIKFFIEKATAQMLSLASRVPEALDDELKERLSEKPVEEKKPEEKDKKEEKKKEEKKEVSEEEAASGLGQLFG